MVIDNEPHTIIGVMPHALQLPSSDTRLWRPISVSPFWDVEARNFRESDALEVIGRLAPTHTFDEAQTEMRLIAARLRDAYAGNKNLDVRVTPLFDYVVGEQAQRAMSLGSPPCSRCWRLPAPTSAVSSRSVPCAGVRSSRCDPPSVPDDGA